MKYTITISLICTMALLLCLPFATTRAQEGGGITEQESVKVTVLDFVRAETDMTMVRYVKGKYNEKKTKNEE